MSSCSGRAWPRECRSPGLGGLSSSFAPCSLACRLPAGRQRHGCGWDRRAYLYMSAGWAHECWPLAGELADGALPLLFPPEHYHTAAQQIGDAARRAGRDPDSLDIAACVWCSLDTDRARARRALAEKIAYYGASFSPYLLARATVASDEFHPIQSAMSRRDVERAIELVTPKMLNLGIAGNAEELAERCTTLIAAGARHISFGPPIGPDPERAVTALGLEVLPILHAAWQRRTRDSGRSDVPV